MKVEVITRVESRTTSELRIASVLVKGLENLWNISFFNLSSLGEFQCTIFALTTDHPKCTVK